MDPITVAGGSLRRDVKACIQRAHKPNVGCGLHRQIGIQESIGARVIGESDRQGSLCPVARSGLNPDELLYERIHSYHRYCEYGAEEA